MENEYLPDRPMFKEKKEDFGTLSPGLSRNINPIVESMYDNHLLINAPTYDPWEGFMEKSGLLDRFQHGLAQQNYDDYRELLLKNRSEALIVTDQMEIQTMKGLLDDAYKRRNQLDGRSTILGRTTGQDIHDYNDVMSRLGSGHEIYEVDDFSAEQMAKHEGTSDIVLKEALVDLFTGRILTNDRKALFKWESILLSHLDEVDEDWTDERKESAWTELNRSDVYGPILQMMGMSKDDIMSTNNKAHMWYRINSLRNNATTEFIIKNKPRGVTSHLIQAKRFVFDNFLNDPDTVIELGLTAAAVGATVVTGGLAGGAILAIKGGMLAGKVSRAGSGVRAARAAIKGVEYGRYVVNSARHVQRIIPTQISSELVMPLFKSVKAQKGFWKGVRHIDKVDTSSTRQFVLGAFVDGSVSEFGAYFTNLHNMIEQADLVYGEGNHGVGFDMKALMFSTAAGGAAGVALGSVIRGAFSVSGKFAQKNLKALKKSMAESEWAEMVLNIAADWEELTTGHYAESLLEDASLAPAFVHNTELTEWSQTTGLTMTDALATVRSRTNRRDFSPDELTAEVNRVMQEELAVRLKEGEAVRNAAGKPDSDLANRVESTRDAVTKDEAEAAVNGRIPETDEEVVKSMEDAAEASEARSEVTKRENDRQRILDLADRLWGQTKDQANKDLKTAETDGQRDEIAQVREERRVEIDQQKEQALKEVDEKLASAKENYEKIKQSDKDKGWVAHAETTPVSSAIRANKSTRVNRRYDERLELIQDLNDRNVLTVGALRVMLKESDLPPALRIELEEELGILLDPENPRAGTEEVELGEAQGIIDKLRASEMINAYNINVSDIIDYASFGDLSTEVEIKAEIDKLQEERRQLQLQRLYVFGKDEDPRVFKLGKDVRDEQKVKHDAEAKKPREDVMADARTPEAIRRQLGVLDEILARSAGARRMKMEADNDRVSKDTLRLMIPEEWQGLVDTLFGDPDLWVGNEISLTDVDNVILTRMASVDESVSAVRTSQITILLRRLEAKDAVGRYFDSDLNRLDLNTKEQEVAKVLAAERKRRNGGREFAGKATTQAEYRQKVLTGIRNELKSPSVRGPHVARHIRQHFGLPRNEGIDAHVETILEKIEEQYFEGGIEQLGNGTLDYADGIHVGRGIIQQLSGMREGHRRHLERELKEFDPKTREPHFSTFIQQVVSKNYAAGSTDSTRMKMYENFLEFARSNHILYKADDNGEMTLRELTIEDLEKMAKDIEELHKKKLSEHQIERAAKTRLIHDKAAYDPEAAYINLEQRVQEAKRDLLMLPTAIVRTLHDSVTGSMTGSMGDVRIGGVGIWAPRELQGLGAGWASMFTAPGSILHAHNRAYEAMFPEASGFAQRAVDAFDQLISSLDKERPTYGGAFRTYRGIREGRLKTLRDKGWTEDRIAARSRDVESEQEVMVGRVLNRKAYEDEVLEVVDRFEEAGDTETAETVIDMSGEVTIGDIDGTTGRVSKTHTDAKVLHGVESHKVNEAVREAVSAEMGGDETVQIVVDVVGDTYRNKNGAGEWRETTYEVVEITLDELVAYRDQRYVVEAETRSIDNLPQGVIEAYKAAKEAGDEAEMKKIARKAFVLEAIRHQQDVMLNDPNIGENMDAEANGQNIIFSYVLMRKIIQGNVSILQEEGLLAMDPTRIRTKDGEELVYGWGSEESSRLYERTGEYVREQVQKGTKKDNEQGSLGFWAGVFKEGREASDPALRNLMKNPVMTVPYFAGKPSVLKGIKEWLSDAKTWQQMDGMIEIDGRVIELESLTEAEIEAHAEWLTDGLLQRKGEQFHAWVNKALDLPAMEGEEGSIYDMFFNDAVRQGDTKTPGFQALSRMSDSARDTYITENFQENDRMMALVILRREIMKSRWRNAPKAVREAKEKEIDEAYKLQVIPMLEAVDNMALETNDTNRIKQAGLREGLKYSEQTMGLNYLMRTAKQLDPENLQELSDFLGIDVNDLHPMARMSVEKGIFDGVFQSGEGRLFRMQGLGQSTDATKTAREKTMENPAGQYFTDEDPVGSNTRDDEWANATDEEWDAEMDRRVRQRVYQQVLMEASAHYGTNALPDIQGDSHADPTLEDFYSQWHGRNEGEKQRQIALARKLKQLEDIDFDAELAKALESGDSYRHTQLLKQQQWLKSYSHIRSGKMVNERTLDLEDEVLSSDGDRYFGHYDGIEGAMPLHARHNFDTDFGIPAIRRIGLENTPTARRQAMLRKAEETNQVTNDTVFSYDEIVQRAGDKDMSEAMPIKPVAVDYLADLDYGELSLEEHRYNLRRELDDYAASKKIDINNPESGVQTYGQLYAMKIQEDLLEIWRYDMDAARALDDAGDREAAELEAEEKYHRALYRHTGWARDAATRIQSSLKPPMEAARRLPRGDNYRQGLQELAGYGLAHRLDAWLAPEAVKSGQVLRIHTRSGGYADNAKHGMFARVIQAQDSTHIILGAYNFEQGIRIMMDADPKSKGMTPLQWMRKRMNTMDGQEFSEALARALLGPDIELKGNIDFAFTFGKQDFIDGNVQHHLTPEMWAKVEDMGIVNMENGVPVFKDQSEDLPDEMQLIKAFTTMFGSQVALHKMKGNIRVALTFNERVRSMMTKEGREFEWKQQLMHFINSKWLPVNMEKSKGLGRYETRSDQFGETEERARIKAAKDAEALAALDMMKTKREPNYLVPDFNLELEFPGTGVRQTARFVSFDKENGHDMSVITGHLARSWWDKIKDYYENQGERQAFPIHDGGERVEQQAMVLAYSGHVTAETYARFYPEPENKYNPRTKRERDPLQKKGEPEKTQDYAQWERDRDAAMALANEMRAGEAQARVFINAGIHTRALVEATNLGNDATPLHMIRFLINEGLSPEAAHYHADHILETAAINQAFEDTAPTPTRTDDELDEMLDTEMQQIDRDVPPETGVYDPFAERAKAEADMIRAENEEESRSARTLPPDRPDGVTPDDLVDAGIKDSPEDVDVTMEDLIDAGMKDSPEDVDVVKKSAEDILAEDARLASDEAMADDALERPDMLHLIELEETLLYTPTELPDDIMKLSAEARASLVHQLGQVFQDLADNPRLGYRRLDRTLKELREDYAIIRNQMGTEVDEATRMNDQDTLDMMTALGGRLVMIQHAFSWASGPDTAGKKQALTNRYEAEKTKVIDPSNKPFGWWGKKDNFATLGQKAIEVNRWLDQLMDPDTHHHEPPRKPHLRQLEARHAKVVEEIKDRWGGQKYRESLKDPDYRRLYAEQKDLEAEIDDINDWFNTPQEDKRKLKRAILTEEDARTVRGIFAANPALLDVADQVRFQVRRGMDERLGQARVLWNIDDEGDFGYYGNVRLWAGMSTNRRLGGNLRAMDVILHELGHIAYWKAFGFDKNPGNHPELAELNEMFRGDNGREMMDELFTAMYPDDPTYRDNMMYYLYDGTTDEHQATEFFAQFFSFLMMSRANDPLAYQAGVNAVGGEGLDTNVSKFSSEVARISHELRTIIDKHAKSDPHIAAFKDALDRVMGHGLAYDVDSAPHLRYQQNWRVMHGYNAGTDNVSGTPSGALPEPANLFGRGGKPKGRAGETPYEFNKRMKKWVDEQLAKPNLSVADRLALEAQRDALVSKLMLNSTQFDHTRTDQEIVDRLSRVDDDGKVDLSDASYHERLELIFHKLNGVRDSEGNELLAGLQETVVGIENPEYASVVGRMMASNIGHTLRKNLNRIGAPWTGQAQLIHSKFNLIRLLTQLSDEQSLQSSSRWNALDHSPTLQTMSVAHTATWEAVEMSVLNWRHNHSQYAKDPQMEMEFLEEIGRWMVTDNAITPDSFKDPGGDPEHTLARQKFAQSLKKLTATRMIGAFKDAKAAGLISQHVYNSFVSKDGKSLKRLPVYFKASGPLDNATNRMVMNRVANKIIHNLTSNDKAILNEDVMVLREILPDPDNTHSFEDALDEMKTNDPKTWALVARYSDPEMDWTNREPSYADLERGIRVMLEEVRQGNVTLGDLGPKAKQAYIDGVKNARGINPKHRARLEGQDGADQRMNLDPRRGREMKSAKVSYKGLSVAHILARRVINRARNAEDMFMGESYLPIEDLYNDADLAAMVDTNVAAAAARFSRGFAWKARSTNHIQDLVGIRGVGWEDLLQAVTYMSDAEGGQMAYNVSGQQLEYQTGGITGKQTEELAMGLKLLYRRYLVAGRNLTRPNDHGNEIINFLAKVGHQAVMVVNAPNFLIASGAVEANISLLKKLGSSVMNDLEELKGLQDVWSKKRREEVALGLGFVIHYAGRGIGTSVFYGSGYDAIVDAGLIPEMAQASSGFEGTLRKASNLAMTHFKGFQMILRAAEIRPAIMDMRKHLDAMMTLRDIQAKEGAPKTKKDFRTQIRRAGLNSLKYHEVQNWVDTGVIANIDEVKVILDSLPDNDYANWVALDTELMLMTDGDAYNKRQLALTSLKNAVWNRASRTNLEQRTGTAPVTVETTVGELGARLTSYPTQAFNAIRNMSFASGGVIATSHLLAYFVFEQLYQRILEMGSGRDLSDILKEMREDPIGSFFTGMSRLPMLGVGSFATSSLVDALRGWGYAMDLPFGHESVKNRRPQFGRTGAEISINTGFRALSTILGISAESLINGEMAEIDEKRMLRALKAAPVPYRPLAALLINRLYGDQETSSRRRRSGVRQAQGPRDATVRGRPGSIQASTSPVYQPQKAPKGQADPGVTEAVSSIINSNKHIKAPGSLGE